MRGIYIIGVLNRFSIIFALLNLIFTIFGYAENNSILYLWSVILTIIIAYSTSKGFRYRYLIYASIFMPLFMGGSLYRMAFIIIVCGYGVYYGVSKDNSNFHIALSDFYRDIGIIFVMSFLALLMGTFNLMNNISAQYILINLVTHTVILRYLRFTRYSRESQELGRVNAIYGISASIFALIISIDGFRKLIITLISAVYNLFMDIFMKAFSWLFIGIGYVVEKILRTILRNAKLNEINPQVQQAEGKPEELIGRGLLQRLLDNRYFILVVKLLFLLLIAYAAIKLFKKIYNNANDVDEYHEKKEFIQGDELSKPNKGISMLWNFLKPRSFEESIRYNYLRFLKQLKNSGIEIQKSDTSINVNTKAANKVDGKLLTELREIYLPVRYGLKKCDKSLVKKFAQLIKQTKNYL